PSPGHPVWARIEAQGIARDEGGGLVLRRTVGADGRSRAFINDQPVSVALLREAGATLVEIQGQFEQHGLLDGATHRGLLDAYGGDRAELAAVAEAWRAWREASRRRAAHEAALAGARGEEDALRHALGEIEALDPLPDEERELAEQRGL